MATIAKNFRVKNGLVVEGTTATVNGHDVITSNDTTDAIDEGATNQYFTDVRAKTSAATLLTGASLTNITITGDEEGLTISAENGVADSDTDDLQEGATNLYFTAQRAIDAVVDGAVDTDDIEEGATNLYFTNQRAIDAVIEGAVDTDDIEEGATNLYFTNQRAIDAVIEGAVDTDDIEEGATNLYFTAQRAVDAVVDGAVDTDDIEEGTTNLYHTATRVYDKVDSIITAGTGITVTSDAMGETITVEVDTDEIATKQYVDILAEGLHIHESVAAATNDKLADLVAGTATYNNGAGTITLSVALTTLDGVSLTNGMRILVKNEGDAGGAGAPANGIYTWATGGTVLTRAVDFNSPEEIAGGDFVFVTSGTNYNSTGWVQTDNVTTVGTDPIEWVQFSGAGTFIGGTGIDITGQEVSIDFTEFDTDEVTEGSTNLYFTDQRAIDAVINGAVDTDDIEEGATNLYFTNQRAIDAVIEGAVDTDDIEEGATNLYFTAQRAVDAVVDGAVDTDDIEEGATNQYFTDVRAKTSAANLLTGASLTNITITGDESGLTISAENGVADSDTDDLQEGATNLYFTAQRAVDAVVDGAVDTDDIEEGTSNLYFTDQRAVDALEAVTPSFTEIDVNSIALNVASTVTVAVQSTTGTVYSFDSAEYTSAKFLVKADTATHTEITEVLLTLDSSSNIAITEYAIVNTGGALVTITAVMDDTDVKLQATAVNDNTVIRTYGTLIV